MITIHEKTAQKFDTLGLGALLPSSCVVKEEVNGSYELKMSHSYDNGEKWKRIERGRIIYAPTKRGMQPFRIYNVKPNMSNIEVNARHIFYDLLDNQCSEVSFNGTASGALAVLQGAFAFPMPFSFDTNISVSGTMKTGRMNPVQALLSDDDESTSFVKGFGGELLRDGFNVALKTSMGQDRDVTIRYGKNLVGLDVTEDEAEVKTRIMCYGSNGSATVDSPYINEYVYPKIHTLEDEEKTVAELKAEAQALFDGGIDIPLVNIKVDFIVLADTVEYADYAPLEEVFLGDIVTIINQKMDFAKRARVISYEWDCLLEKYNEVELGDFMPTLVSSVTSGVRSGSLASAAAVGTSAVSAALQAHLNDFNNPHKTQTSDGSSLPEVTTKDNGKVLMVDAGDWAAKELEKYLGEYEVTPSTSAVVLSTASLLMSKDVTVNAIPESYTDEVYNNGYNNGYNDGRNAGNEEKPYACELPYLQFDGNQYFNMGFKPNQDTRFAVDIDVDARSNQSTILGCRTAYHNSAFLLFTAANNAGYQCDYGNTGVDSTSTKSSGRHTIDFNKNVLSIDGVVEYTHTYTSFQTSYNMYLLSVNNAGTAMTAYPVSGKLYSAQHYANGVLSGDYIPVLDWNYVACLYDKVTGTFLYNAGTGSFAFSDNDSSISVKSITTTGSYNSTTYHGNCYGAIDSNGNLLLVVEGGTSTSYESIYFTVSSVPSGVSLVKQSYYSYASMSASMAYVAIFSGIKDSVDITLNFNSVNSSNDYTQCAVTIAYTT